MLLLTPIFLSSDYESLVLVTPSPSMWITAGLLPATMEVAGPIVWGHTISSFGNRPPFSKSSRGEALLSMSTVDKIAGLKEILALDPKNSFARYGIAVELANRGEIDAAMAEFDKLLSIDPDYTAGYFMAAQTLAKHGRTAEAIARLKSGISCAARADNRHALSEMQSMLDELAR